MLLKLPNDIIGVLVPDYWDEWKAQRDKTAGRRGSLKPAAELTGGWRGEIKTYEESASVPVRSGRGHSLREFRCR